MAFASYTQSFGIENANGDVFITETSTGTPATVMATTTGGVINTQGYAKLDSAGDLAVIIDTAKTWTFKVFDGDSTGYVAEFTAPERLALRTAVANKVVSGVLPVNAQTGTAYTLILTDAGKEITMTNASANTLTIPPNASVAFPVGTVIKVTMDGAGITTIAAGAGVTATKPAARSLAISARYESAWLTKTATNTWRVVAD